MANRKTTMTRADRAREAFSGNGQALEPASPLNALMPWFSPSLWLHIEYQRIEIRLEDGEARISCERKSYRDGIVSEETLEARAPMEQYVAAVDQMQQQAQRMMQLMLMPWVLLMPPFASRDRKP